MEIKTNSAPSVKFFLFMSGRKIVFEAFLTNDESCLLIMRKLANSLENNTH